LFFYKNPIVKTLGVNKGETFEDDNVIFGYKNKVIKNIIEDIRELLDDDFFNFEMLELKSKIFNEYSFIFIINKINCFGVPKPIFVNKELLIKLSIKFNELLKINFSL
jgi:hypothetical protein